MVLPQLFVKRLGAGGRDGVTLLDQFSGQRLRRRHQLRPGVRVAKQVWRGVESEVGWGDIGEIGPRDGERHRRTRSKPWAVRGSDASAASSGGVEKHFAFAIGFDERGRRDGRVERLGPHRQRARGQGDLVGARAHYGNEHVHALRPAGLYRTGHAHLRQRVTNQLGRRDDRAEVAAFGWVQVQHQMGRGIGFGDPEQGGMKFDGALIREPQQGARSLHNAYAISRFDAADQTGVVATHSGVYFGTFFCMNGFWPRRARMTDNGRSRSASITCRCSASR